MILVEVDGTGVPCPECGTFLEVQATWECNGPPLPNERLPCPKCGKKLDVEQHVITILRRIT